MALSFEESKRMAAEMAAEGSAGDLVKVVTLLGAAVVAVPHSGSRSSRLGRLGGGLRRPRA